jgi:hypothetical protein
MINLSHETEVLAKRLVEAQRLSIEDAIRRALEHQALHHGPCRGKSFASLSGGA